MIKAEGNMPNRETGALRKDLRQQAYDLLEQTREPSDAERNALEAMGFVFLQIRRKSLPEVIAEDPDYFYRPELFYSDLAQDETKVYVPPAAMEIAFNPDELFLPDSFDTNRDTALAKVEAYSRRKIERISPGAKAILLPETMDAQADREYKDKTGVVLFKDAVTWALDNVSDVQAAVVGRDTNIVCCEARNIRSLMVDFVHNANESYQNLGAAPGVIFVAKSA